MYYMYLLVLDISEVGENYNWDDEVVLCGLKTISSFPSGLSRILKCTLNPLRIGMQEGNTTSCIKWHLLLANKFYANNSVF